MFNRQSGEIGIMDEVRLNAVQCEKLAEDFAVLFGRLRHPDPVTAEPGYDLPPSLSCRRRPGKDARVGNDAQERNDARPR